MATRYSMLRKTVANLAAPAEVQVAYLDDILSGLTHGRSAAGYGNNELALEFEDGFSAVGHMLGYGEITEDEIAALRTIDLLFDGLGGAENEEFWQRPALFTDPRWQVIRTRAAAVLAALPDEARESDYTRSPAD